MAKSEHQSESRESNQSGSVQAPGRDGAGKGRASLPVPGVAPAPPPVRIDPRHLTPQAVMALQRTAGNRAVAGLLGRKAQPVPGIQAPADLSATRPRIQRNEESGKILTELAKPKVMEGPEIELQQGIVKSLEAEIAKDEDKYRMKLLLYLGSVEITKPIGEEFESIIEGARLVNSEDNALGAHLNGYDLVMAAGAEKSIILNTLRTMQEAGQLKYLRESGLIDKDWKLVIEIHYYRDRYKQGHVFHKDTLGQTLFVNLNYNTSDEIAGPEFVINPPKVEAHELQIAETLPPVFLADLETVRAGLPDPERIDTAMVPAFGVVAFVDEAIHHMTPLVGHRSARPSEMKETLSKLYTDDYTRAKSAYEKFNNRWFSYTYERYLPKDLQKDADMWFELIEMTEADSRRRFDRTDFEAAKVPALMIGDLLDTERNSGFSSVSIPDRKVVDMPRPNEGRSLKGDVDSRKKRLVRRMSILAKNDKLPKESAEKRSFFRTWVRAVPRGD